MNHYTVTYYNSGGYKTTAAFDTEYELRTDANNCIAVFEGDRCLGDVEHLEELLLHELGWHEEITIVRAEPRPQ